MITYSGKQRLLEVNLNGQINGLGNFSQKTITFRSMSCEFSYFS